MPIEAIAACRVGDLLTPTGFLVMWCTWPLIDRQAAIMRDFGIRPVTGGAWAKRTASGKLRWGTGYVLRSVCEPFLVGTLLGAGIAKGKCKNLVETMEGAAIDGLAREHSRKPDEFYGPIEALVLDGRRADIFARQRRAGWSSFGRELDKFPELPAARAEAAR